MENHNPAATTDPVLGRFSSANIRAAVWAFRAARRTKRALRRQGLDAALSPPPPPLLPAAAERGVRALLRRRGYTCLVRSIVLQTWYAAHGEPRELIIGVTDPRDAFRAHAWLDGEPSHPAGPFGELLRRPPPAPPQRPVGARSREA